MGILGVLEKVVISVNKMSKNSRVKLNAQKDFEEQAQLRDLCMQVLTI